ncbi:PfkB family carbohydrate kinase [Ornithinimicrobium pratense]|uniref:Sugar kinase n=1 Tax=Ornithinimicrobium pratense TaxID=2593973 RepID=A0A5J6V8P7_9MICO|nr:PfkB family carbohydrate kinase [Ornithinimicrobium pratense]QFG70178.1 sugar kinase [Ornithinimicrobium pratense]
MARVNRRVIHTGQAMVDLVVEVPHLPVRGGNVNARTATRYAGGSVTILVAAARQGATAVQAGAVGTGPNGDLVRETLAREGAQLSSPPVPDLDTGVCVVMVEPSAERSFVTTRAAERQISVESLGTSRPGPGDVVCVTGYSLYEPTRDPLLEWLGSLADGVLVVLDPGAPFAGFDAALVARMLDATDVWTSNAQEAQELTGVCGAEASCAAVAQRLPDGAVVIVRDGPVGAFVHVAGETTHVPGYPQTPVDTNGAGDTHTGVLCAGAASGLGWVEACRRANAAGAIKVTRNGPATSPTASEVEEFLARQHGTA